MKPHNTLAIVCLLAVCGCHAVDRLTDRSTRPTAGGFARAGADTPPTPAAASYAATAAEIAPVTFQPDEVTAAETEQTEPFGPAHQLPAGDLSLADLEAMGLQNNPALAQWSSRLAAAEGNWLQVGLPPNPTAGYSGQQLGSGGQAEQQGVFLGQQFVTGKKLQLNRQVAAWEIQQVQQQLEAARLKVLTDVRMAYYEVLIAQRRRDLAAELVGISDKAAAAAEALFQADEVSLADPLRARVDADSARILLYTATNQHQAAWRRLTAVAGVPELSLVRINGELDPEQLGISWEATLPRILAESPEMSAAIAQAEAAHWAIHREQAEVVADIEVQAVIQDDRGTGQTNGNLQISVPLPILNRNQGGIQRAHAAAMAAEMAVDRLALDLQRRFAAVFQRYDSARNQVQQYARPGGILENAERTQQLVRAGYQAEEFGVLDMLTAQRTYFQTNLAYFDSLLELWTSAMEIRGLLLKDSLQD